MSLVGPSGLAAITPHGDLLGLLLDFGPFAAKTTFRSAISSRTRESSEPFRSSSDKATTKTRRSSESGKSSSDSGGGVIHKVNHKVDSMPTLNAEEICPAYARGEKGNSSRYWDGWRSVDRCSRCGLLSAHRLTVTVECS